MTDRLDPNTERKLLRLGNKKYFKTLALTILWCVGVLSAGAVWAILSERPINSPSNFIFPLLCILPFYPLKVHKLLRTRTFYGKVESAKYSSQYKTTTGPITWNQAKELEFLTADVVFKGNHGEKFVVTYKESSVLSKDIYYKQDDRVLVIRGLKYPVKLPIPDDAEYICPVCGNFIKPGEKRCQWCRSDFSDDR